MWYFRCHHSHFFSTSITIYLQENFLNISKFHFKSSGLSPKGNLKYFYILHPDRPRIRCIDTNDIAVSNWRFIDFICISTNYKSIINRSLVCFMYFRTSKFMLNFYISFQYISHGLTFRMKMFYFSKILFWNMSFSFRTKPIKLTSFNYSH